MNNIKQLEERISQLTELVKTGSEAIKNMKIALKAAEEERDRLADQRRENEPKFERGNKFEPYWSIQFDNAFIGGASICKRMEHGENYYDDMTNFRYNNYFKTVQRAEEIADKINFLLRLERLYDTFCPDYAPDWGDWCVEKWKIDYENSQDRYRALSALSTESKTAVYFPTKEIAQKVCDILNKELEEKI
jgi:hypothetical protein